LGERDIQIASNLRGFDHNANLSKSKTPHEAVFYFLVDPREIETYTRPGDDFPAFFKENRGF
jgi:hypothetical protein